MLIDVWGLMKSYVPAKDRSVVAEKFVDIAMDNGIEDEELKELMGHDDELGCRKSSNCHARGK